MIITFCGHADFSAKEKYQKYLLTLFESIIGDNEAELFLGGYGNFDNFAYECGNIYKKTHPNVSLTLVTPYLKCKIEFEMYDSILYPELEGVPLKFAISHRNRYMVDKSDVVVAYITHEWGGAYQTYSYAKRKKKTIYNLYK